MGGDRNVYFRREGCSIRRSSHALIGDRREIHTDAPTATALFQALQDEDCVVYAHIGVDQVIAAGGLDLEVRVFRPGVVQCI